MLLLIALFSTDRIIAMSFPSSGKQSFYRNPIEVKISHLPSSVFLNAVSLLGSH